jgi:hypothetical protein
MSLQFDHIEWKKNPIRKEIAAGGANAWYWYNEE